MAFGRRREASISDDSLDDSLDVRDHTSDVEGDDSAVESERSRGPADFATDGLPDLPEAWGRMDLGALVLTLPDGVEVRLDVDEASQTVGAVGVVLEPLMLQVMAYAAPRTAGIWDEIRDEIAANATSSGGTVHAAPGRFGTELLAQLPAEGGGRVEARFIGVDGPRWFVRGVVSGPGAHDDEVSARALDILGLVTVVRDDEARPSQEPLPVTVPRDPQQRTVPLDD
jgi:hypothetical protein